MIAPDLQVQVGGGERGFVIVDGGGDDDGGDCDCDCVGDDNGSGSAQWVCMWLRILP